MYMQAEGETQYVNRATFLDLRNTKSTSINVTIDIPKNAVPGSEHIEISAVGNVVKLLKFIIRFK